MKKLFTLLVGVLLGGSAFGQTNWTSVITNGDMEGDVPAYSALDQNTADAWSSFWVHEWKKDDMTARYDGTAEIVADPADASNHVAKIYVRTRAEGEEAGNLTPDYTGAAGTYASWDCQFMIYATAHIPAGKEIRLQMKIKGEKAGSMEVQAHSLPGTYIDQSLWSNISYDTEWKEYKSDVIQVSSSQGDGGFQSVTFNVSTSAEGNTIYFDDIKLQIRDPKESGGDASWINFMRKGVYSDDPIGETNYGSEEEPNMVKISNFMIQIRDSESGGNILTQAPIVETGDPQFPYAVKVPTLNHYSETVQIPDLDADGNEQPDGEGGILMKDSTTYYWADGSVIGTSAPARYSSQFFVSTLHKMKSNERYKFVFWVKAEKPANLGTQAHTMPTKYAAYDTFGGTSAFPVSTEWTKFELGEPQGQKIPGGANGCQTIAFDCYDLQEENNYYFVFEEFSFSEENVTIEDRTLGTPEDIQLPVNTDDNDKATPIDATPMLKAFEVENFDFLKNPKPTDGIKLYTMIQPDDPEDDPTPSFAAILGWNDGGFINGNGLSIDDDMGINIRFDEESVDGNNVDMVVWNNPDSGIDFSDGKTVQTKLAVSQSGWYYIYNITLGTEETLAGISPVKAVKVDNGYIYNLSGQRVDASYKGLVIKNGQKLIQK